MDQTTLDQNMTQSDYQVRWLNTVSELAPAEWNALFPDGNPFVQHGFLSSLEDSGSADPESGWAPRHLLVEEGGRLVAALPLYIKSHSYGEFVFDWGWAQAWERHGLPYYPKLVTAVPFTPSVGPRLGLANSADADALGAVVRAAIVAETRRLGMSGWHLLFANRRSRELLAGDGKEGPLLRRQDTQFHFLNPGFDDFDDFLKTLRASRRKNVRKERRKVALQGVEMTRCVGSDISEPDWQAFYRCYVSTFMKRSGHAGYLTREFFQLLRERLPEQLMLVVARRADTVVAGALFLFDRERLYGRWWGALEHVDCLHFETCFYQGMEFAIEQGLRVFDPGTQGEHKLLRGFEPVTTHSLHYISDERFRAAIADFLERERPHSEAYGENAAALLPFRRDQAGDDQTGNDQTGDDQTGGEERPGRGGRKTS